MMPPTYLRTACTLWGVSLPGAAAGNGNCCLATHAFMLHRFVIFQSVIFSLSWSHPLLVSTHSPQNQMKLQMRICGQCCFCFFIWVGIVFVFVKIFKCYYVLTFKAGLILFFVATCSERWWSLVIIWWSGLRHYVWVSKLFWATTVKLKVALGHKNVTSFVMKNARNNTTVKTK